MKIKLLTLFTLLLFIFTHFNVNAQVSSAFNPIKLGETQDYLKIKGDMTMTGNSVVDYDFSTRRNIVNRANNSLTNTRTWMRLIDVDRDGSTTNSSSADITLPDCSQVVWAGLYWSAMAPGANVSQYGTVKFKASAANVGNYLDITNTQVLAAAENSEHYTCYADITNLVGNSTATYTVGNIHNDVVVGQNTSDTGAAAGWVIAVIYKNEKFGKQRYFTVFQGDATIQDHIYDRWGRIRVSKNPSQDITVTGFKTVPGVEKSWSNPSGKVPVEVEILAAALEGDKSIPGDKFGVQPDGGGNFNWLSNSGGKIKNFFNSSYDERGRSNFNQIPNLGYTIGIDAHLIQLPNADNVNVKNDDTSATFRYNTSGDLYFPYLMIFSAEIIRPQLTITNTVHSGGALFGDKNKSKNDLSIHHTPQKSVKLGHTFFYDVCFENTSTESAQEIIFENELPYGVTLETSNNYFAPSPVTLDGKKQEVRYGKVSGVSYDVETSSDSFKFDYSKGDSVHPDKIKFLEYTPPKDGVGAKLIFKIGNNLGENSSVKNIKCFRLKVKLDDDCNKFREACGNPNGNQIIAKYVGEITRLPVVDKSYPDFGECKYAPGETKFLIDRGECNTDLKKYLEHHICLGQELKLVAGSGFADYTWYKDVKGSWELIPGEKTATLVLSGETSDLGKYQVKKTKPGKADCVNGVDTFKVIKSAVAKNPFKDISDDFKICGEADRFSIAEFYLCGNDVATNTKKIELLYGKNVNVSWEKLTSTVKPDLIPDQNSDCANYEAKGDWEWKEMSMSDGTVSGPLDSDTSKNFLMTTAGEYRVKTDIDGICVQYYYFRVFNPKFKSAFTKLNRLCNNNGAILVADLSEQYKIKLEKKIKPTPSSGYEWETSVDWVDGESFTTKTTHSFGDLDLGTYRYVLELKDNKEAKKKCPFVSEPIAIENKPFSLDHKPGSVFCVSTLNDTPTYSVNVEFTPVGSEDGTTFVYELYKASKTDDLPSGVWENDAKLDTPTPSDVSPTFSKDLRSSTAMSEKFDLDPSFKYKMVVTATSTKINVTTKCRDVVTIDLPLPKPLSLISNVVKNISCKDGTSPAVIELNASGGPGSPVYTHSFVRLDGKNGKEIQPKIYTSVGNGSKVIHEIKYDENLADEYPLYYRYKLQENGNSCPVTSDVEIKVADPFKFEVSPVDAKCSSDNKGSITITLKDPPKTNQLIQYEVVGSGGNIVIKYDKPISYTNMITENELKPDTYTVNIKVWESKHLYDNYRNSSYECDYSPYTVTVKSPQNITDGNAVPDNVKCDTNKGTITFKEPTTGSGPYEYLIYKATTKTLVDSSKTKLIFDVVADKYDCVIVDSEGCKQEFNNIVVADAPADPKFIIKAPVYDCGGTGVVSISPYPNGNSYKYVIKDASTQVVVYPIDTPDVTTPIFSDGSFSNVQAGKYTVDITYAPGCTVNGLSFTVEEGQGLTASISKETKTPVKCKDGKDGTAILTVTNFDTATGYWYKNISVTDSDFIGPTTKSSPKLENIPGGVNVFEIYYKNPSIPENREKCTAKVTVTIEESETDLIITDIKPIQLECEKTSVSVTPVAIGGTKVSEDTAPYYTYSYAPVSPSPTEKSWIPMSGKSFTFKAGTYIIRVIDKYNCEDKTEPFTIKSSAAPEFTLTEVDDCDNRYGENADIKVTFAEGTVPAISGYQYQIGTSTEPTDAWPNDNVLTLIDTSNPLVYKLSSGSKVGDNQIHIRVKDGNGCHNSKPFAVKDTLSFVINNTLPASACDNKKDASISISLMQGGSGSGSGYKFALVKSGQPQPASTSFIGLETDNIITIPAADIPVGGSQDYDVYMKDSNDCISKKRTTTVTRHNKIKVVITKDYKACTTIAPKIKITNLEGGTGTYTITAYNVDGTQVGSELKGITSTNFSDKTITVTKGNKYYVTVVDADACSENSNTIDFLDTSELNAVIKEKKQPVCEADSGIVVITKPNNQADSVTAEYIYTLTNSDVTPNIVIDATSAAATVELKVPADGKYKLIVAPKVITETSGCPQDLGEIEIKALVEAPTFKQNVEYDCEGKATIKLTLATPDALPTGPAPNGIKLTFVLNNDFSKAKTEKEVKETGFSVPAGVATHNITVYYTRTGQTVVGPLETITERTPCSVPVKVKTENKIFSASLVKGSTDVKCINTASGTIKFKVENFNTESGFFYKYDKTFGGTTTTVKGDSKDSPVTISELPVGTTTIYVYSTSVDRDKDNTKCRQKVETTLSAPDLELMLTIADVTLKCDQTKTSILPKATGGWSTEYNYAIANYDISSDGPGAWSTSKSAPFNIGAGFYYIQVTDAKGCTKPSNKFEVKKAANLDVALENYGSECLPYGDNANVILVLVNGESIHDYTYTLTNSKGTFTQDKFIFSKYSGLDEKYQDAFTYIVSSGTTAGKNTFKITNKVTNCTLTKEVEVNEELSFTVIPKNPTSCTKGNFSFQNIKGGDGSYKYYVTEKNEKPDAKLITTDVPANLVLFKPGKDDGYEFSEDSKTYYIWVKDGNGCIKDVSKVLSKPAKLKVTVTANQKICSTDTATLTVSVTGGAPEYNIELFDKTNMLTPITGYTFSKLSLANATEKIITIKNSDIPISGRTFVVKVIDTDSCDVLSTDQKMDYGSEAKAKLLSTVQPLCLDDKGIVTIKNPLTTGDNPATGPFNYTLTLTATTSSTSIGKQFFVRSDADDQKIPGNTIIKIGTHGTYDLKVTDLGHGETASGCPQNLGPITIEPVISKPEFEIKKGDLNILCNGKATVKISPVAGDNLNSALSAGIKFYYALKTNVTSSFPKPSTDFADGYVEINDTGVFTVSSATDKYVVDVFYINKDVTFDPKNITSDLYPCWNASALDFSIAPNLEFSAIKISQTALICKTDPANTNPNANNTGTATFKLSNFALNDLNAVYYYKIGTSESTYGDIKSDSKAKLLIEGLPLGKNYFIFAPSKADFDNADCRSKIVVDIIEPTNKLELTHKITGIKCTENPKAKITPTASGGTPGIAPKSDYTYFIGESATGPWGSADTSFTKPVGTKKYWLKVKDGAGCEAYTGPFTIEAPEIPSFKVDEILCEYGPNANVTLTNTSATLDTTTEYQYQIVGSNSWSDKFTFDANDKFVLTNGPNAPVSGLNVGENTITVRNALSLCSSTFKITIQPVLSFTMNDIVPSSCENGGFEIITKAGGHPVYTFAVVEAPSTTAPTSGFVNLVDKNSIKIPDDIKITAHSGSKKYVVWMKDSKGCTISSDEKELTKDALLSVKLDLEKAECEGSVAKLAYTITGGKNNYSVQLVKIEGSNEIPVGTPKDSFDGIGFFNILPQDPALKYKVKVLDARNCPESATSELIEVGKLLDGTVVSITQPTCKLQTGSVLFTAPTQQIGNKTPKYVFSLEESTGGSDITPGTSIVGGKVFIASNPSKPLEVSGVTPGTYTAVITDSSIPEPNCPQRIREITILPVPNRALKFTHKLTYDCDGVPTLVITPDAGDASANPVVLGSAPSDFDASYYGTNDRKYTYTISGGASGSTPALPLSQVSDVDTGVAEIKLPVGEFTYTVDVANGLGCVTSKAFTVDVEEKIFNVIEVSPKAVTCYNKEDGELSIKVEYPNPNMTGVSDPTSAVEGFYYRVSPEKAWTAQQGNVVNITNLKPDVETSVELSYDNSDDGACVKNVKVNIPNVNELIITDVNLIKPMGCSPDGNSPAELNVLTEGTIVNSDFNYKYIVQKQNTAGDYVEVVSSSSDQLPLKIFEKGTYKIILKDGSPNECQTEYSPVIIKEPKKVDFTLSSTCLDNNGKSVLSINTVEFDTSTPVKLSNPRFILETVSGVTLNITPKKITETEFQIPGLSAGTYNLVVNDDTNCSNTKQISIDNAITFRPVVVNESCNPGKITITDIKGGKATTIAPYGYEYAVVVSGTSVADADWFTGSLDPVTNKPFATFTVPTIALGTPRPYDIFVKSNGCISKLKQVTVKRIKDVIVKESPNGVIDPTCDVNGSISVDINFGSPNYKVELFKINGTSKQLISTKTVNGILASGSTPASGTAYFGDVPVGDYKVVVTDNTECKSNLDISLIGPPELPLNLVIQTPDNKNCTPYSELDPILKAQYIVGAYLVRDPLTPVDLSSPEYAGYDIDISIDGGGRFDPGYEVKNIIPDTEYHVIIRMTKKATATTPKKVVCVKDLGRGKMPLNVLGLVLNAEFSGDCTSGFDVVLDVDEGIGPFRFSMDNGLNWSDAAFTVVEDASGNPIVKDGITETTLTLPSGEKYYRGIRFSGLTLGQHYDFKVIDLETSCTRDNEGEPIYDLPVDIDAVVKKNICFDDLATSSSGEIVFTVTNKPDVLGSIETNKDVSFTWTLFKRTALVPTGVSTGNTGIATLLKGSNKVKIPKIVGLDKGTYYLQIKINDTNECEYSSKDVKIEINTEITVKLETIRDVTCDVDGLVRIVNVTGGESDYDYTVTGISNITTALTAKGLDIFIPKIAVTPGKKKAEISVIATDKNGCNSTNPDNTATVNVSENPIIDAKISDTCSRDKKSITIEVKNQDVSSPVYTYEYLAPGFDQANPGSWNWIVSKTVVNGSHTIADLSDSGDYKVRVKDSSGCYSNIADVKLEDALDFTLSNAVTSCHTNSNIISISNFKGSGNYTWKVVEGVGGGVPDPIEGEVLSNDDVVKISVNKNSSYAILLTDIGTNCSKKLSIQTQDGDKPDFNIGNTPVNCFDGSFTVSMDNPNLEYSIRTSTSVVGTAGAKSIKQGNSYIFTSMDFTKPVNQEFIITGKSKVNSCTTDIPVTVTIPAKINMEVIATPFGCTKDNVMDNITITPSNIKGGTGKYQIAELFKVGTTKNVSVGVLGTSTTAFSNPVFKLDDLYADGGNFFVRVYDDKGCSGDSESFTIAKFDKLKSINYNAVNATNCAGKETIKINFTSEFNDPSKVKITYTYGTTTTELNSPYEVEFDKANKPYKINIVHRETGCNLPELLHKFSETPRVIINAIPKVVSCKEGEDGSVSINVDNYTGTDYVYDITGPTTKSGTSVSPTFTVEGLKAGTYTLKLKLSEYSHKIGTSADCGEEKTFIIREPEDKLELDVTKQDLTCLDSNNGKLEYSASNGWGSPYSYKVEKVDAITGTINVLNVITPLSDPGINGGYGKDVSLSNLLPGFYKITVKDSSGCDETVVFKEINNPTDITGIVAPFECGDNGSATKVTVTASGGTILPKPDYTYILYKAEDLTTSIKEQDSNVFSISDAGDYAIKVKDRNGCISSGYMTYNGSNTFTISPKLVVNGAQETQAVTCNTDGFATLDIVSGSGNYTYTVTNVTDSTVQTGSVTSGAGVTSGAASFKFITKVISPATGNEYNVVIKDNVSTCEDTKTFNIAPAATPVYTITDILSVCSSTEYKVRLTSETDLTYNVVLPTGTVLASVVDRIDSKTSIITITKSVNTEVIENVIFVGTDAVTGCSEKKFKDVKLLNNIIAPIEVKTSQFLCATDTNTKSDASITLDTEPSGGAGAPYKAELWKVSSPNDVNVNSKTNVVKGIDFIVNTPGEYYIKLYDSTDICYVVSDIEPIKPFEVLPIVAVRPVADSRSCDGSEKIVLDWTKPTPISPIEVSIVDKDGTLVGTKLTAPSNSEIVVYENKQPYMITITNTDTGCIVEQKYKLSPPPTPKIKVTPTHVVCNGTNSGKIAFEFADSNYSGNYTFEVFKVDGAGNITGSALGTVVDKTVSDLLAGNYIAVVQRLDDSKCTSKEPFEIKESNDALVVDITPTNFTCNNANNGKLSFTSKGGWGDNKYTVEKVDSSGNSLSPVEILLTNSTQREVFNLTEGFYKVTVTDKNGCSNSDVKEIKNPAVITATYTQTKDDCSVIDTKVTFVTVSGGTPEVVNGKDVYTYNIYKEDGTLYAGPLTGGENTQNFNVNDAGTYYGTITDSKNCVVKLANFTIYNKLKFEVLHESLSTSCDVPGEVRFKISGGKGTYTYKVEGATTGTLNSSDITMISAYEGTFKTDNANNNQVYTVTVTDAGVSTSATPPVDCSINKSITISPWIEPSFDVQETKPVCSTDYYILKPDNTNLVYEVNTTATTLDIDTSVPGVIYIKKNVTEAVAVTVDVIGKFSGTSACPTTKSILVSFDEDINVPSLIKSEFTCTAGSNDSNEANIAVTFTETGAAPYTASLWKVKSFDGTVLNPLNAIQAKPYASGTNFDVTDISGGTFEVRIFDKTNICYSKAEVVINPFVELKLPSIKRLADTRSCNDTEDVLVTWDKTSANVQLEIVPGANSTTLASTHTGGAINVLVPTKVTLQEGDEIVLHDTASDCKITEVYSLTPKVNYQINVIKKDVCIADTNGEATFSFVGTPSYDISNPSNTFTYKVYADTDTSYSTSLGTVSPTDSKTITGLAKGNYIAVVKMTAFPDCVVTKPFIIEEPKALLFVDAKTKATDVRCKGDSNGIIEFSIEGGWGSYTYEIFNVTGGGSTPINTTPAYNGIDTFISRLPVGKYKVIATDKNKCTVEKTLEIKDPTIIEAEKLIIEDCDPVLGAKVTVLNAKGGLVTANAVDPNGYEYVLYKDGGTVIYTGPQSNNVFMVEEPGTYQVKVFNDKGCSSEFIKFNGSDSFTIYSKLKFNLEESKSVTCKASGEVVIKLTPASGNYTISVKEPVTTANPAPVFTDLASGVTSFITDFNNVGKEYTVRVIDNNSNSTPKCFVEETIKVSNPALPYFTTTEIPSDCFGSPYTAVFSNTNLEYTHTTSLNADVIITDNMIEVSQVNGDNDALIGQVTVIGTDKLTGCKNNVILEINIPEKVNVITKPAVQFNCANKTNTVNTAMVQAGIAPADVANFTQAVLYKVVTGGTDEFMDIKSITSADISFDVTDYKGGDYYIRLFKGSCGTNTKAVTIKPFVKLDSYTLIVLDQTDCAGKEKIQITPATGTTITVKDKSGTVVPSLGTSNDEYEVMDDENKYPYNVIVTNDTSVCELVGTYIPGPKKTYILDSKITHAYCTPSSGVDAEGNPKYGTATGSLSFNFADVTPYPGNFTYKVMNIDTPTSPVAVASATYDTTNNSVSNLPAGKYKLVLNLTPSNCDVSSEFEIVSPAAPLNFDYVLNPITCDRAKANMSITARDGGSFLYKYTVKGTGTTNFDYEGYDNYIPSLEEGTYDVTVTDIYNCTLTKNISIEKPNPIQAKVESSPNNCNGDKKGEITVTGTSATGGPTGGIQNNTDYWYILEYPTGVKSSAQTSNVFKDLSEGKYNVYVLGDGGCKSEPLSVELTDPIKGEITAEFVSGAGCDTRKAKVKVIAKSDANGPYTIFMLDGSGAVSETRTNSPGKETFELSPNANGESYTFYAQDGKGCFTGVTKYSVPVVKPLQAEVKYIKQKTSCHDSYDGVVEIIASGGVGIRNYTLLQNGVPVDLPKHKKESNLFTDLAAGDYKVKVTNDPDVDCSVTTTIFTIDAPEKLDFDVKATSPLCYGETGEIIVVAKGGNSNGDGTGYKYSISSDAAGRVRDSGHFKNLEPGEEYVVTIFDVNGRCPVSTDPITIVAAKPIKGTIENIIDKVCSSLADPSFEVKLEDGVKKPYFVSLSQNGPFIEIPNNGNRYKFTTEVDKIKPGNTYNIYAKDSRDCKSVNIGRVKLKKTIDLGFKLYPVVYDCDTSGKSLINATIGDKYVGQVEFILWRLDPSNGEYRDIGHSETGKFVDLPDGRYYVAVKLLSPLTSTCEDRSDEFDIKYSKDTLEIINVDTSQMNSLTVNVKGGIEPYEYSFDGGITFVSSNIYRYSSTSDYNIIVKDARGCITSTDAEGTFESIIIPNYFTPDGDNINDYWYPRNVRTYHNINVSIFDRYSREIKEFKGDSKGWDGKYNGKALPRGDYWYRVRYTELTGSIIDKVGHFTLYRKE